MFLGQVLGHPSSIYYGFCLIECALRHVSYCWLIPQALCNHCSSISCREYIIVNKGSVVGFVFMVFIQEHAEYVPVPTTL